MEIWLFFLFEDTCLAVNFKKLNKNLTWMRELGNFRVTDFIDIHF